MFQLDGGTENPIINKETRRISDKPILTLPKEIARGITGQKFKFKGDIYSIPVAVKLYTRCPDYITYTILHNRG